MSDNSEIMIEVDVFLERYTTHAMTFALEYSATIDWCAEFVPGRNHPKARDYGSFWLQQDTSRERAIRRAMAFTERILTDTPGSGEGA